MDFSPFPFSHELHLGIGIFAIRHLYFYKQGLAIYSYQKVRTTFSDFMKIGLPMNIVVGLATCFAINGLC